MELLRRDPFGLLATAFYVAANGYGSECGGLLCTCVELGHDEGEEYVLRGVMTWERKAAGRGERVRPRLCHAAMVGDVSRLQRLVRAGAWLIGTDERGWTALMVAVEGGHAAVVRELLACEGAGGAFVGARIAVSKANAGHTAFSFACFWTHDHERKLTEGERAVYATIARLLVASGHVEPGDLGGSDATALSWACYAGLPDVVTTLLASPLCTRAVVIATDVSGSSAFSEACILAADRLEGERKFSVLERAAGAACARVLAASPRLHSADTARNGYTALASACDAGLADIVTTWLADARCTAGVVRQRSAGGRTSASRLLARTALTRRLTPTERRDTAACARALGGCAHVPQASREALMAAAVTCEGGGGGGAALHTG